MYLGDYALEEGRLFTRLQCSFLQQSQNVERVKGRGVVRGVGASYYLFTDSPLSLHTLSRLLPLVILQQPFCHSFFCHSFFCLYPLLQDLSPTCKYFQQLNNMHFTIRRGYVNLCVMQKTISVYSESF